jgi:hypothetical protein
MKIIIQEVDNQPKKEVLMLENVKPKYYFRSLSFKEKEE